ncbi:MAG: hypothetical protein LBB93_00770 [Elusimicrobiota bacterium]|nr:hypothetical protein [Elusimicrobiota bacterium]
MSCFNNCGVLCWRRSMGVFLLIQASLLTIAPENPHITNMALMGAGLND